MFIVKNYELCEGVKSKCFRRKLEDMMLNLNSLKKDLIKFVDYLSSIFFNSMPLYIKIKCNNNSRNYKKSNVNKIIVDWLIRSLDW